jgi:formamidopyrimidine-DNA glycosylase
MQGAPGSRYRAAVPELLEVETYRRQAEATMGRLIATVELLDPRYWRGSLPPSVLHGARVERARRRGKLLLLDTDAATLGIRFGMTGRLLVDGLASIERLEYSSGRDLVEWHRVVLRFDEGGTLTVTDPRRLGWVELDPGESRLGVDAATVRLAELRSALGHSSAPLKARLMDQARVAGLGNLLTDEILWRSRLDPRRAAGGLSAAELRRLHHHLHRVLDELGARGGSHTGDLQSSRLPGSLCPRDGAPLRKDTVGGRTTWWCPEHQR